MDYSDKRDAVTNMSNGITTEYATAGIVIGCLIALILIRRGFRGLRVPGVGAVGIG